MSRHLHLSPAEISFQAGSIFGIISRGESGVIVCHPGCKIDYNLNCYLGSAKLRKRWLGRYHKRFVLATVPISASTTEQQVIERMKQVLVSEGVDVGSGASLTDMVLAVGNSGREMYALLVPTQPLAPDSLRQVLTLLQTTIMSSTRFGAILFTEQNIHEPWLARILADHHKFLQNVSYFPVYSFTESVEFLRRLAEDLGITLPLAVRQEIAFVGGGYLWLMRAIVRQLTEEREAKLAMEVVYSSSLVELRVASLLGQLTEAEASILEMVAAGKEVGGRRLEQQFLLSTGVLRQDGKQFSVAPLIARCLRGSIDGSRLMLDEQGRVVVNERVVEKSFSQRELKVLSLLLRQREVVVSRQEIAQELWGEDWSARYSDWAIDKMVSRLRRQLKASGVDEGMLVVKKGRGVMIR